MKQSAVEFVFDAVYKDIPYSELLGLIAQAKIIEKEQKGYSEEDMQEAFTNGLNRSFDSDFDRWFEQFKKK